ncbi:MAG TPA: TIGR03668 family PPOX class F420-dependent oxidoreductase [Candidatus Dormibacteraeota bacterium]
MRRRFAGARVARLATIGPDDAPRLVPICFVLEGDLIHSVVDAKPKRTQQLARLAAVAREPRVAVLVDEWSEDWSQLWWVRADGRARVTDPAPEVLARLAAKYPQYRSAPPPGPALEVTVERWSGWAP